jgi:hypothetical protein
VRDDRDTTPGEFTNAHPALAEFWHPVAMSAEVGREPVAVRLAGAGWALARFGDDRRGLSFTAVREHTFTNLTDPAVREGARPAVQRRRMTYRYQAPLTPTVNG